MSKGKTHCLNYLSAPGVPLLGNRAKQTHAASRCRVKLAEPGPYKGKYVDLGKSSCQMKGGTPGQKLVECKGCDRETGNAKCKKLCDSNDECGAYSVAKHHDHANCMLWLRPRGFSLGGGGKW